MTPLLIKMSLSLGSREMGSARKLDWESLPMGGFKISSLNGSPLPKIPWRTTVRVTNLFTKKTTDLQLIDVGPPRRSGVAIALTEAAFEALGGDHRCKSATEF